MKERSLAVRRPAVAGTFYPLEPSALRSLLRQCFDAAIAPYPDPPEPKALVVPHAGYVYSGPVAATAYLRLEPIRSTIRRVVLLGPSHHVPLVGLALSSAAAWESPLGAVRVDGAVMSDLGRLEQVTIDDMAHAAEHSLEVQLPFLQSMLDDFSLVPLAVGAANPDEVAEVLAAVWTERGTLVVVSSDLSHYHPYARAVERDARTASAIGRLDALEIGDRDACGARPLRGLLRAAEHRGMKVEQLDLRNSGDTAGDRARVVGYGAFVLV